MFERGDRRERLSKFYARHRHCSALRTYMWSGGGQVVIRAKCKPSCDARTILTVNNRDMTTWLCDERGAMLGRAVDLYARAHSGDRCGIVIGGGTADEARALWDQGDLCIVAPLEWV